jgi:hypothetical protein
VYSGAHVWNGQLTWHWQDWPAEAPLEHKQRADPRISVPISLRRRQFVREDGRVRPVARPVRVRERPPVAVPLSGAQTSRDGGRR